MSLGFVSRGLGCRRVSPGLYGGGVGIALVGMEVGGNKRIGLHALHSRMLSCVEVAGFLFCLIWVRLFFFIRRVWAGDFSVAMCLVLGGVVEVAGVWVGCGKILRRWGGSVCVCGERGVGDVLDLCLGRLGVWVCRVWGCCIV